MSNGVNGFRVTWQEKLEAHCQLARIPSPVFTLVSDRRGGRTAWSSSVVVQGQTFTARYFYDGDYINNAKDDAAEVALTQLSSQCLPSIPIIRQGQVYAKS